MSESPTIDTLFALLEAYTVEVPIVQRDYAQGRLDDHTNMVRNNLLKDIRSAILRETPPLDLNFVYGKEEGAKFIPVDGQQRLTTLFLLHLYAFRDDESKIELLRKFTYETRQSSRKFLEDLTEKRASVFSSELSPSKEIEDSEWFVSIWKHDPTIQSALTMLDAIKENFGNVENLAQNLSGQEFKPIVFKFLEMKDLGMEDSLYIKLNARGRSLTPFENFRARLIGRLHKLSLDFADKFERYLDGKWTDLFWANDKEKFDQTYLAFFGGLFISTDANWSSVLDYNKVEAGIFETAFFTLNFLCDNPECEEIHQLVFKALSEKSSYQDRVLFHAVAAYMYKAKGVDNGSLKQWIRIIRNLTLNSRIDEKDLYINAVNGINKLTSNWERLLVYFSQNGGVTGFSQEQIREEQSKARIILQSDEFAEAIYKAERHRYFSGQIRSALNYAIGHDGAFDMEAFMRYWDKISALFDDARPKHRNLLRRALLTFRDYTLKVGEFKTLCVDDPNEAVRTPSMKQLFSNHGKIVKQFLDTLNLDDHIERQLQDIVNNSAVPKNDWRYCFIEFDGLFVDWSPFHLRLREIDGEWLIIPNKFANGYNRGVFLAALHEALKLCKVDSSLEGEQGTRAERYLRTKGFDVQFKDGKFIIKNATGSVVFQTTTDDPIAEAKQYLLK